MRHATLEERAGVELGLPMMQFKAGRHLRGIRQKLNFTLKDVEVLSGRTAEARQNPDFIISAARLSQVEASGSVPSLYKLASLSEIYHVSYIKLLRLYGIDPLGQHKKGKVVKPEVFGSD